MTRLAMTRLAMTRLVMTRLVMTGRRADRHCCAGKHAPVAVCALAGSGRTRSAWGRRCGREEGGEGGDGARCGRIGTKERGERVRARERERERERGCGCERKLVREEAGERGCAGE
jgi:hypothetical protein